MNEKLLKIFGGVIAGFVLLILILLLISSCTKKSYTYEKLEDEMLKVGKRYFEKDKSRLPEVRKEAEYTLEDMIKDGKIKSLDELFKKEKVDCKGKVIVLNNNDEYIYTTELTCGKDGKDYKTKYLSDKIIEDNLVTTGIGLYKEVTYSKPVENAPQDAQNDQTVEQDDNNTTTTVEPEYIYVMKGETKNNYISILGKMYRIIRINKDGSIRVIEEAPTFTSVWDNRYNNETKKNTGFNQYLLPNNIDSRLKEKLEKYYSNDKKFPVEMKQYVVPHDVCVGDRNGDDTSKDGSTECKTLVENRYISTLAVYEYLDASLDQYCINTGAKACKNYNWIAKLGYKAWTLTPVQLTENQAYSFDFYIENQNCNITSNVYGVFDIYSKVKYISGDGSKNDPYKFIKYDEKK